MDIHYRNISCEALTDAEIAESAELFSANYGVWAASAGAKRAGKGIRLSPARVRAMFVYVPDRRVVFMYDGDKLIGQVYYLRRPSPWHKGRFVTFVLQLVLDRRYRGNRFGLKMLQAVFGLSDDDAWGLFTSNPLTIRALEDATFRRIDVSVVRRSVDTGLRTALYDVFPSEAWLDSFRQGCVDTGFHVGHEANDRKIAKAYPDRAFPFAEMLHEGEEWLAVIRRDQKVYVSAKIVKSLTSTSLTILNDAYSRMNVENHAWASHADREIEFLFSRGYVKPGDRVLDLGCGCGRHSVELARRGVLVHGVDFSERLLARARSLAGGISNLSFECADARSYIPNEPFDVVLCLYDVLGSSIDATDDRAIAATIRRCLKKDGLAIVSAMNLDLTRRRVGNRTANLFSDISTLRDFTKLMNLPASRTMQQSGDIFKGQLILLNPQTGVTYRREQFVEENALPTEYVIPDRRYTAAQLGKLFKGFSMVHSSCVSAGRWNEPLRLDEGHAKEALCVFRKLSSLKRITQHFSTKKEANQHHCHLSPSTSTSSLDLLTPTPIPNSSL